MVQPLSLGTRSQEYHHNSPYLTRVQSNTLSNSVNTSQLVKIPSLASLMAYATIYIFSRKTPHDQTQPKKTAYDRNSSKQQLLIPTTSQQHNSIHKKKTENQSY